MFTYANILQGAPVPNEAIQQQLAQQIIGWVVEYFILEKLPYPYGHVNDSEGLLAQCTNSTAVKTITKAA